VAQTRITPGARRASRVATGVPELDRLLELMARTGRFSLTLQVPDDEPEAEVDAAGTEIGRALRAPLRAAQAHGHGLGMMPADEALATVVVETSERPLVAANVDLAESHLGGLEADLSRRFLDALAQAAGLTIHVRLVEGVETQHVVDAIFKALGGALADACATT
jgi:imidazoleglycerol-phosphate dehydratase